MINETVKAEILGELDANPNICRKDLRSRADVFADVRDSLCDRDVLRSYVDGLRPDCSDVCEVKCPYQSDA